MNSEMGTSFVPRNDRVSFAAYLFYRFVCILYRALSAAVLGRRRRYNASNLGHSTGTIQHNDE